MFSDTATTTSHGVSSTTSMFISANDSTTTTTITSFGPLSTTPSGSPVATTLAAVKLPTSSHSGSSSSYTTPPPTTRPPPPIPMTRRPSSPLIQARYSPLILSSAQIERSRTDPFSDRHSSQSDSNAAQNNSSSPSAPSHIASLSSSWRTSSFVTLLRASGTPGSGEERAVRNARRDVSRKLDHEAAKHRAALVSAQQEWVKRGTSTNFADRTGDTTEDESEVELVIPPRKANGTARVTSKSGSAEAHYILSNSAPESPSAQFEREAEAERVMESQERKEAILETLRAAAPRRQFSPPRPSFRTCVPLTGDTKKVFEDPRVGLPTTSPTQTVRSATATTQISSAKDDESGNDSDCSRRSNGSTKRKAGCITDPTHDPASTRPLQRRKPSPHHPTAPSPSQEHPLFTASRRLHALTTPSLIPLPTTSASLDCHHHHTTCPLLHHLGLLPSDDISIHSPHPRTHAPHLTHCSVHPANTNSNACHIRHHDPRWLHKQAHIWANIQSRFEAVAKEGCKDWWSEEKVRECGEAYMRVLQEAWRALWMCEEGPRHGLVEVRGCDKENEEFGGRVLKRLGNFGRVRRMGGVGLGKGGPLQMLAQGEVVIRPVDGLGECELSRVVEMGAQEGERAVEHDNVTEECNGAKVKEKEKEKEETAGKNKDKHKVREMGKEKEQKRRRKARELTPLMDEYDVKSPNYTNEEFRRSCNSIR